MKRDLDVQFAQLLDMATPSAVFEEVKYNFIHHYPVCEFLSVRDSFKAFNELYEGKYPGYGKCNTKYHDKIHTTDALLAMSRLIDGYNLQSAKKLPLSKVKIALIATVFHDAGYIQRKNDHKGTGAKFTLDHVERSVEFLEVYLKKHGFSKNDFKFAASIVRCTGLEVKLDNLYFSNPSERILGLMLGTSDLIGQMASRTYLERLLHLYREFKEGHVGSYKSGFDLLVKTIGFYAMIKKRLEIDLENSDKYALKHFEKRYRIKENLYHISIARHMQHLQRILKGGPKGYQEKLKRSSEI